MDRRILITGADGFIASHLLEELHASGCGRVMGIGLGPAPPLFSGMEYRRLDLFEFEPLMKLVSGFRPEWTFHLAAQSSVALSWDRPDSTYRINIIAQVNLLEALRRLDEEVSVHVPGSGEQYGKVSPEEVPIREEAPQVPCNHYAASKVAQEAVARMYHQAYGCRTLITRGFNQAGPRQSDSFVVSSFAKQVALIEAGALEPVMKVGNLEPRRDFTDVRDTVRAYRMLMERGRGGTAYNVCSGAARPISELLEILLGMSKAEIRVESDPARFRVSDVPLVLGDNGLIRAETGWEPLIPIEKTLEDTLDYWRSVIAGKQPA